MKGTHTHYEQAYSYYKAKLIAEHRTKHKVKQITRIITKLFLFPQKEQNKRAR